MQMCLALHKIDLIHVITSDKISNRRYRVDHSEMAYRENTATEEMLPGVRYLHWWNLN